ncbi:hypothetical protein T05_4665, partial [Trichinella murrelli]
MEMKIDSNLSVHERTSRFRSDVKIENKNENNNTDKRESISVSIFCSSPSSPESHIHEILIPGIHQRTSRFRSD